MDSILSRLNFSDVSGIASLVGLGALSMFTAYGVISNALLPSEHHGRRSDGGGKLAGAPVADVVVKVARWLTCPIATSAAAWTLLHHPAEFMSVLPAVFSSYAGAALNKVLPVHPKNFHEAFQLGQVLERIDAAASSSAEAANKIIEDALALATQIAGRNVTLADLRAVPAELKLWAESRSTTQRILAAFSLINIIWGISILGLTLTVSPFLYFIAEPVCRVIIKLWSDIVIPILIALKPAYEPLMYAVSFFVLVESARYPRDDPYSMAGTFTALSGIAGVMLSWGYTTYLNSKGGGDAETWASLATALLVAVSAPMAILHQSKLIGYVTVCSFMGLIGFCGFATRCCLMIGFESRNAAARAAATCLVLVLINASARALQLQGPYLKPFESAINCVATSVYFLALDILSTWGDNRATYFFIANLASMMVLGTWLGQEGMTNSAKAWSVILGLSMYGSHPPKGGIIVVWSFSLFAILYGVSLYFSRNPALIAQLFPGF